MRHHLLCMPSMNLTRHTNISMAYHFNMPPLGLALVLGYRLAPSPCPSTSSPLPRPLRRWRLLGSATASPPCLPLRHWAACCLVGFLETIVSRRPRIPIVQAFPKTHHPFSRKMGMTARCTGLVPTFTDTCVFCESGNSGNSGNMKHPTRRKPAPVLVLLLSKA